MIYVTRRLGADGWGAVPTAAVAMSGRSRSQLGKGQAVGLDEPPHTNDQTFTALVEFHVLNFIYISSLMDLHSY
jgi:hypothetical protein